MTCSSPTCTAYQELLEAFNAGRRVHTHALALALGFPVLAALDGLGPQLAASFVNLAGQITALVDIDEGRAVLLLDDFPEELRVMVSTNDLNLMTEVMSRLIFTDL